MANLENKAIAFLDEFSQTRTKASAYAMPEPISLDEWITARPTPDCIVENFLFADVGVLVAAGGVGKTTKQLYEAIHIVLGLQLYGLEIRKQGSVLIITAEDSREMLVARLRAIADELNLSNEEKLLVMERVRISDLSGNGFRLTEVVGDVVMPSGGCDTVIEVAKQLNPVLVVIDPAVSFGVGESRVNDAEQGLVEAARKLRRALNCCVLYIHHSGKQNGRDKTVDQYSGRGGSAFADGARMVHVLVNMTPKDWLDATGTELLAGESGLMLARPKMSYCAPVGDILIKRTGYKFEHVKRVTNSRERSNNLAADQVWQLLTNELSQGRYHSKNSIEGLDLGLKRGEIRTAISMLFASLRVELRDIPNSTKGGRHSYLHPIASPNDTAKQTQNTPKNTGNLASLNIVIASPPPIGNSTAANQPPPFEPFFSYGSPSIDGEAMAKLANQSNDVTKECL